MADRSHRPHHHPNQHTEEELKLIRNMRRRNPNTGLVVLWVKLRQRGYSRSVSGLYRVLTRSGQMAVKLPNPKYIPKPYEPMQYPGQRGQIDVKFVPAACLVGEAAGKKFYQYTFIDEYSRFRYLEAFEEHSTYTSALFIQHVAEKFPYVIECIQTDNGTEFTNRLNSKNTAKKTLFEQTLAQLGIRHKLIRPFTPRHNGKVERSHRKDNEEFYASHKFFSFHDFVRISFLLTRTVICSIVNINHKKIGCSHLATPETFTHKLFLYSQPPSLYCGYYSSSATTAFDFQL